MLDKLTTTGLEPQPSEGSVFLGDFYFKKIFLVHSFILCVCVCGGGHMYHSTCAIKGQHAEICSLFSSRGFRGSNSGHQACRQVPSAAEPSLSAHHVRFLCLSLLSTVTVERREVRSPGSAARVGRSIMEMPMFTVTMEAKLVRRQAPFRPKVPAGE